MTATYINNSYVAFEALSLLFTFLEILVAYNVVNLDTFVPIWNDNPADDNIDTDIEMNIFNLSYLGYLNSEANQQQVVGWAYMGWSLLSCISIVRRARQSLVRKIQEDDKIGTHTVETKIGARALEAPDHAAVKKVSNSEGPGVRSEATG